MANTAKTVLVIGGTGAQGIPVVKGWSTLLPLHQWLLTIFESFGI